LFVSFMEILILDRNLLLSEVIIELNWVFWGISNRSIFVAPASGINFETVRGMSFVPLFNLLDPVQIFYLMDVEIELVCKEILILICLSKTLVLMRIIHNMLFIKRDILFVNLMNTIKLLILFYRYISWFLP
jgi:hypothetical protein